MTPARNVGSYVESMRRGVIVRRLNMLVMRRTIFQRRRLPVRQLSTGPRYGSEWEDGFSAFGGGQIAHHRLPSEDGLARCLLEDEDIL